MSGSVRDGSLNTAALCTVREILGRRHGSFATPGLDLTALPYYDQNADRGPGPDAVCTARGVVSAADALIISTPSYNGAMSGVLKNALDWLSRPWGASALTGKPVAVLTASTGRTGGADAQPELLRVLERAGAFPVAHPKVAITAGEEMISAAGTFLRPSVVAALDGLVDATLTTLSRQPALSQAG
ncbi:NADPH-dependent FMN reductase [Streptomyces luteolus]|uniref:NAD(P)H-dependent oxidoreductase n=1 Tax=Streptomyces luteolus TaxID=3043615 RepID=A0ABT6T8M7_9ACTN|nr:NAD(P)H-dependent oxidoreductase [Streptomyces sp. B-S-A12]MDI3424236.1 NAD(P)H-dependent oxidoreductase [Streptomyces sp. B-S-A12]